MSAVFGAGDHGGRSSYTVCSIYPRLQGFVAGVADFAHVRHGHAGWQRRSIALFDAAGDGQKQVAERWIGVVD